MKQFSRGLPTYLVYQSSTAIRIRRDRYADRYSNLPNTHPQISPYLLGTYLVFPNPTRYLESTYSFHFISSRPISSHLVQFYPFSFIPFLTSLSNLKLKPNINFIIILSTNHVTIDSILLNAYLPTYLHRYLPISLLQFPSFT